MKSTLRRKELLNYLEKNHIGYTSKLCQELQVSAMTIHRDFGLGQTGAGYAYPRRRCYRPGFLWKKGALLLIVPVWCGRE